MGKRSPKIIGIATEQKAQVREDPIYADQGQEAQKIQHEGRDPITKKKIIGTYLQGN